MFSAAQAQEFSLPKTIEALRATRELGVSLEGLKALHEACRKPGRQGWAHLLSYLRASPTCGELSNIWEAQASSKDPRVFPQLLLLVAHIIAAAPPVEPEAPEPGSRATDPAGRSLLAAAQQALITQALGRRLRTLYSALGSDNQQFTNAALQVLTAVAGHSAVAARDLVAAFDWSLSALTKICRPARERPTDDKQQASGGRGGAHRHPPAAANWQHPNVLSRPRRAMFVTLCRTLLDGADHATLARLLPLRPLMGGLLHFLSTDPRAQALETLMVLGRRVLAPGAPGLPPRLRAEPFGDTALKQLAEVAATTDDPLPSKAAAGGSRTDAAAAAALAAEAALEALVALCTDPENGLVTHGPAPALAASAATYMGAEEGAGAEGAWGDGRGSGDYQYGSGVKRVLRLLPRLRPFERVRHLRLLHEVAARRPWLAAEFASSMPYDLQPQVSVRWVGAMTLAARLTAAAAAGAPAPVLELFGTAPAAADTPPAFDSALVRAHLRCCLPPALPKAVLSRGVQHTRLVVQFLTLNMLHAMLQAVEPLAAAVLAGQAAAVATAATAAADPRPAVRARSVAAVAWAQFYQRLCSYLRSRLPDLQTLLALHASLTGEKQGLGGAGGGGESTGADAASGDAGAAAAAKGGNGDGGEADEEGEEEAADEQERRESAREEDGEDVAVAGMDLDQPGKEGHGAPKAGHPGAKGSASAAGQGGGGGKQLLAAVFGAAAASADPALVREEVVVRLLEVLAAYCRLLPGAVADSHFDAVKLVPQDVVALSERRQLALLGVLDAATTAGEPQEGASGGCVGPAAAAAVTVAPPLSTALVAPLLRLLTRGASPRVRAAAGDILGRRTRALVQPVGGSSATAGNPGAPLPDSPSSLSCPSPLSSVCAACCLEGVDQLELQLWLWMLPAVPPAPPPAAHQVPGGDPGGGADRAADAVLSFLADVLVSASRRPQDGYELTLGWLPAAPSGQALASGFSQLAALALRNCLRLLRSQRARPGGEGERTAVCAYVAGVLHHLIQQQADPWVMVHVLERALLAEWAAAAAKAAAKPGAKTAAATAAAAAAPNGDPALNIGVGEVVVMPPEGRSLASLYSWAVRYCSDRSAALAATSVPGDLLAAAAAAPAPCGAAAGGGGAGSPVGTSVPTAASDERVAKRRRKSAPATLAAATVDAEEASQAPALGKPWGLGSLRVSVQTVRDGAEASAGKAADGTTATTITATTTTGVDKQQLARHLRELVKDAAKAVRKGDKKRRSSMGSTATAAAAAVSAGELSGDGGGGAGSGLLPADACAALAAAGPLAMQFFARECEEQSEVVRHAVKLLQAAARKAAVEVTPAVAAPAGGSTGGAAALLAALWMYVLAKPLASRCLGPADVLQMCGERHGGSGSGGEAEKAGEDGMEVDGQGKHGQMRRGPDPGELRALIPLPEALDAAAAGAAAAARPKDTIADGNRQLQRPDIFLDSQLMRLLVLQTAFRHEGWSGEAYAAACSAVGGSSSPTEAVVPVGPPPPALVAAARSAAFWIPLLPFCKGVESALCLVRQLLPSQRRPRLPVRAAPATSRGSGTEAGQDAASIAPGSTLAAAVPAWPAALRRAACGALCHVVTSSAVRAVLAPGDPVRKKGAGISGDASGGNTSEAAAAGVSAAAARQAAADLVAETHGLATGGCPGAIEQAWGPVAAAAVRAACGLHIRTALRALRAATRADSDGDSSSGSAEAAMLLLPLVECAPAAELLAVVDELLSAALKGVQKGTAQSTTPRPASDGPVGRQEAAKSGKRGEKRAATAAAGEGDGEGNAGGVAVTRWQRVVLQVGLRLAATLLCDPRVLLLCGSESADWRLAGRQEGDGGEGQAPPAGAAAASEMVAVNDVACRAAHVRRVFGAVLSVLDVLQPGASAPSQGSKKKAAWAADAAEAAAQALCGGLQGPAGYVLALGMTEAALAACVTLAPYSAAAADAAAAALALGPPALRVVFATALPSAVAAAEERRPGIGRRVALARLLPAADVYLRLAGAAAPVGDGGSDPVVGVLRDPLFAYATRKRRKAAPGSAAAGAAAEEEGAMPADAVQRLRSFGVGVLARMLRPQSGAGASAGPNGQPGGGEDSVAEMELHRVLSKLLPPLGSALSLDEDDDSDTDPRGRPPLATSAEQLALAEALLRGALLDCSNSSTGGSAGGVKGPAALAAVSAVLSAAASTLAALFERRVLPSGDGVSPAQRRLLAVCMHCLDGCVGDLLADTSDALRGTAPFATVCRTLEPLAAATAAHAARDPAALRCIRRLLAALLPQAASASGVGDGAGGCDGEGSVGGDSAMAGGSDGEEEEGGLRADGGHEAPEELESSEEDEEEEEEDEEEKEGRGERSDAGSKRLAKSRRAAAAAAASDGSDSSDSSSSSSDQGSSDSSDSGRSSDSSDSSSQQSSEGTSSTSSEDESSEDTDTEDDAAAANAGAAGRDGAAPGPAQAAAAGGADVDMREAGTAGDDDDDDDGDGGVVLQLPYGIVPNAAVAAAAGAMLESLIASPHLPAVFVALEAAAPLPPTVARLPLPLVSLLPLGDAAEASVPSAHQHQQQQPAEATAPAAPDGAEEVEDAVRTEFATLLETLLDLRTAYDVFDAYGRPCGGAADKARKDDNDSSDSDSSDSADGGGEGAAAGAAAGKRPFGRTAAERQVLSVLLQLLQCAYGATLRGSDRAVLRVLLRLDELLMPPAAPPAPALQAAAGVAAAGMGPGPACDDVARRLAGTLARSGFLWGPAARHFYEASAEAAGVAASQSSQLNANAAAGSSQELSSELRGLRAAAVSEHHPPDPRALGLACVHFPTGRTLAADEDDPWVNGTSSGPVRHHTSAAAAASDPAWLLPFAVCCLRDGTATVQDLAGWGLLSLCLRCLACDDVRLRRLSYEAATLAASQLDALAASTAAARAGGGAVAPAGPAAVGPLRTVAASGRGGTVSGIAAAGGVPRTATDFRQRQQLQALLARVRAPQGLAGPNPEQPPAQERPLPAVQLVQLPHTAALFAAEAAVVLTQPQAPMHKPVCRLVERSPSLSLAAPPLFNRVLAAGAPGQRHEQTWALQLLRWGALGPQDAAICRRKFVAQVCTALHGSAASALDATSGGGLTNDSGGSSGEGGGCPGRLLPLRVVRSLAVLPSLGRHLVLHAGIAPWLAQVATSALRESSCRAPASPYPGHHRPLLAQAADSLQRTQGTGHPAPSLPPAAAEALAALSDLVHRRVCLRKRDGDAAVLQYARAAGALAAAATAYGSADLAARVCELVAALAAALPPWRAQPLWRLAVSPAVLLALYDTICATPSPSPPVMAVAATPGMYGGGGSVQLGPQATSYLTAWLQAVLHSSFRPPATTPMAAAPALGPSHGATAALPQLARTAIHAALTLLRSAAATATTASTANLTSVSSHPLSPSLLSASTLAPSPAAAGVLAAAASLTRACLLWLASLAAAGHPLCCTCVPGSSSFASPSGHLAAPEDAAAMSQLLGALWAATTTATTCTSPAAGGVPACPSGGPTRGSAEGPAARLALVANAECQMTVRRQAGVSGGQEAEAEWQWAGAAASVQRLQATVGSELAQRLTVRQRPTQAAVPSGGHPHSHPSAAPARAASLAWLCAVHTALADAAQQAGAGGSGAAGVDSRSGEPDAWGWERAEVEVMECYRSS